MPIRDALGRLCIRQDGRTYHQTFTGRWEADRDIFGNEIVDRDIFGNPRIERDIFGNQVIERDVFGNPIIQNRTSNDSSSFQWVFPYRLVIVLFTIGSIYLAKDCLGSYKPLVLPLSVIVLSLLIGVVTYFYDNRTLYNLEPILFLIPAIGLRMYVKTVTSMWGVVKGDQLLSLCISLMLSVLMTCGAICILTLIPEVDTGPLEIAYFLFVYPLLIYILPFCDSAYKSYGVDYLTRSFLVFVSVIAIIMSFVRIKHASRR